MSTVIISDSSADLRPQDVKKLGIEVVHMPVKFGDELLYDRITITSAEFYRRLETAKELPTTTLVNPDTFMKEFERFPDDDIIVITMSSGLSGTYQSAVTAAQLSERDNIYVIDSYTISIAHGILVREAAALRNQGINTADIIKTIEYLKTKVKVYAVPESLMHLVKGGRLSAVSGVFGTALKIKPIVTAQDGKCVLIGKGRGDKGVAQELKKLMNEKYPCDYSREISLVHTCSEERLDYFCKELGIDGERFIMGAVVGTHIGPGGIGIAYYMK